MALTFGSLAFAKSAGVLAVSDADAEAHLSARYSLMSLFTKRCTNPHRQQISPVAVSSAHAIFIDLPVRQALRSRSLKRYVPAATNAADATAIVPASAHWMPCLSGSPPM